MWYGGGWIQGDTEENWDLFFFLFFSLLVPTTVLCLLNKLMEYLLGVRNAVAKHWIGSEGLGSGLGSTLANLWFGHVTTCQDNIRGRLKTNSSPPLPC